MLRLIYRQRRRLIVGGFFGTLGLMMMVMDQFHVIGLSGEGLSGEGLSSEPAWIVAATLILTAILVWIGFMLAGAVIVLLLPNWRFMVEMIGIVIFANAAMNALFPWVYHIPFIGPLAPFILSMSFFALMYGELLDRFRLWLDYREQRSFVSPKSAQELWAELVPGAAPIEHHWDSLLYSMEPDPDDPDAYQVQYNHGVSLYEHQTMTFLQKDSPHYAKYHHVGEVDPKNRHLVEGTYEIRITPRAKGGCTVTFSDCRSLMLHRLALTVWFDDYLGDQTDHLRARHRGRSDWSLAGRLRRKIGQLS